MMKYNDRKDATPDIDYARSCTGAVSRLIISTTGDANVVAEHKTPRGGEDACEQHIDCGVPCITFVRPPDSRSYQMGCHE